LFNQAIWGLERGDYFFSSAPVCAICGPGSFPSAVRGVSFDRKIPRFYHPGIFRAPPRRSHPLRINGRTLPAEEVPTPAADEIDDASIGKLSKPSHPIVRKNPKISISCAKKTLWRSATSEIRFQLSITLILGPEIFKFFYITEDGINLAGSMPASPFFDTMPWAEQTGRKKKSN